MDKFCILWTFRIFQFFALTQGENLTCVFKCAFYSTVSQCQIGAGDGLSTILFVLVQKWHTNSVAVQLLTCCGYFSTGSLEIFLICYPYTNGSPCLLLKVKMALYLTRCLARVWRIRVWTSLAARWQ